MSSLSETTYVLRDPLRSTTDTAVGDERMPDSMRFDSNSIGDTIDDHSALLHWGQRLELDTTHHTIDEVRFQGLVYRPRMGDFGYVQLFFLFFLVVSIVFLSRGYVHIIRSVQVLKNVFFKNNKARPDFRLRLQSDEETSLTLRVQTLCLYSFAIIYYYYYYSVATIAPFSLFILMLQVSCGAFLVGAVSLGIDHALGALFNEREQMSTLLKIKQVLMELSSFLLWGVVLCLVYSDHFKSLLFGLVIAIFLCTKIIEWIASIVIFTKGIHSILDFILYLCTAEIIPYVLFYQFTEYCYSQSIN